MYLSLQLVVVVCSLMNLLLVAAQDGIMGPGSGCRYLYTEQPPLFLDCNPYTTTSIQLHCTVRTSGVSSGSIEIHWVWVPLFAPQPAHMKDLNYSVQTSTDNSVFSSSILQLHNLNNTYAGTYWCQAVCNDTHLLTRSSVFYLLISQAYSSLQLPVCTEDMDFARNTSKCASFKIIPPNETASQPTPTPTHTITTDSIYHSYTSLQPTVTGSPVLTETHSCSDLEIVLIVSLTLIVLLVLIIAVLAGLVVICNR